VVEVDGGAHASDAARAHDERRRMFIEGEGWSIVRFWNDEVYRSEEGVVATVTEHVMHAVGAGRPLRHPAAPSDASPA
jgi:very-short-patch-repair endonuclease